MAPITRADLERLDAAAAARGIALIPDSPMAPLTTLRVGGPADRMVAVHSRDELLTALALARDAQVPWFVLGNGSDLVVADAGMRGLVIRNRARSVTIDGQLLHADAGAPMALLVRRATEAGLAGLEFGTSIPGTLGGAVWANAGAHGREMRDVTMAVEAWDSSNPDVVRLDVAECAFAYRESRFKHAPEVVVAATVALGQDASEAIAARVAEHQAHRVATQPLADQNAGSVFRNPAGDYAGRLIEAAGLKGTRVGTAAVSTLHANFIVAERGGRASDVRALGDRVRAQVLDRLGVELQYEIEFVGDWPS